MKPAQPGNGPKSPAIKAQIDENLRRVYHEALSDAVPDRFTELLAQLKAKETQK
ncbi:hypothetical protein SAMN05421774_107144 [Gemmobacter megaterium]|uniref:Anti-sigma factor NepR domain-containing protein n=1 Tax=Gemmobacter megaterium TaxID=1086013 RepID=A0A1N7Q6C2_9RHOB|nr:NepR family anti-sigma factor [Gemmobacter megaterium]GGE23465.1 hypothetical protein GCM10011345_31730 [Gemmobacter megaterium]SIT18391.1 hypothetical protein SAMN05421774_107144 [Gemmobacter megaterium]